MTKRLNTKSVLISLIPVLVVACVVLGLSLALVMHSNSEASSEQTYHSNMISKTFTKSSHSSESEMETNADNWVNHIRNIKDYRVIPSFTYNYKTMDGDDNGTVEKEHVVLVKKHETSNQAKIVKYLRRINNANGSGKN